MLRTRAPLTIASPFDLHVLGPPQTFALSQDQTLQFELCSIMIEDSLEPSTGCRCRARRFRSELHDPTGCGLEVHVPTSVMSWFPSSTIQFSGSQSLKDFAFAFRLPVVAAAFAPPPVPFRGGGFYSSPSGESRRFVSLRSICDQGALGGPTKQICTNRAGPGAPRSRSLRDVDR